MNDNLYIIKSYGKDNKSLIKFGYSSDIEARINFYISHNPLIEILYTFYREDGELFERWFHTNHISENKREWYSLEYLPNIIKSIKTKESFSDIEEDYKMCNKCNNVKHVSNFYKKNKSLENMCKTCNHILKYQRVKNDPIKNEKRLESKRRYREANREKHREYMKDYYQRKKRGNLF